MEKLDLVTKFIVIRLISSQAVKYRGDCWGYALLCASRIMVKPGFFRVFLAVRILISNSICTVWGEPSLPPQDLKEPYAESEALIRLH